MGTGISLLQVASILLKHTSEYIATLSNKTTVCVKIVIAPLESTSSFLQHDGFQNIIHFETFFIKIKV